MPLVKSISGIRGTIGGKVGENLTPIDVVLFTSAFTTFLFENRSKNHKLKVVVGRDARISGEIISKIVVATLQSAGIDVIDVGLSTTPTVEMAVILEKADGGIVITASHNPMEWNALKLLNAKGEFISAADGKKLLKIIDENDFSFAQVDQLGSYFIDNKAINKHIEAILQLEAVCKDEIANADFSVVVDGVNSTGGTAIPQLLRALGVKNITVLNGEPTGVFAHNPEPLPEHLHEISNFIKNNRVDVGFVVDPDVDRLAIVMENGELLGEEYTLVAVADYILQHQKGNTVSNLSSTRALRDISEKYGVQYATAAVGEVNVVEKIKEVNAIIGGEGNGGVIYPALHYGRDALVGVALFLSYLAKCKKKCTEIKASLPTYFIAKNKISIPTQCSPNQLFEHLSRLYKNEKINRIDGIKIDFSDSWVHIRASNTEPILRIYAEAQSEEKSQLLVKEVINVIEEYLQLP